jgi:hypothetical protein
VNTDERRRLPDGWTQGIDSALLGLGKASIASLTPDDVVVPPGFTLSHGDGPVFGPALNRQPAED